MHKISHCPRTILMDNFLIYRDKNMISKTKFEFFIKKYFLNIMFKILFSE